jgi:hypothetical protein
MAELPSARPWAALLILLWLGAVLVLAGRAAIGSEASTAARLLARLKAGDTAIDFRVLRLAGTSTRQAKNDIGQTSHWRKTTLQALEARLVDEAATLISEWLAADYLNPFAHLGAQRAHAMRGNAPEAAFHQRVVEGLYDSICVVGEGLSPANPCPVVSADEIHYYLARHRYEIGDRREEVCGALPCLVFEVRAPDGLMLVDLYFDISRLPSVRARVP